MTRQEALKIFASGLNSFLHRNNLTQAAAAALLHCTRSNICNILKETSFPSFESITELAEHGMRLDEIFGADLANKLIAAANAEKTPLEQAQRLRDEMQALLAQLDNEIKGA